MKKNKILLLSEGDKKCLEMARGFILANLSLRYTIRQIASEAGINRYKLTYGFKQQYGISVHQYAIQKRMENAKYLLPETDKPIKEIAQLNGYSNTQNFITAFKKYYGSTPSQFQKKKRRSD